jgi:hypothetical protein
MYPFSPGLPETNALRDGEHSVEYGQRDFRPETMAAVTIRRTLHARETTSRHLARSFMKVSFRQEGLLSKPVAQFIRSNRGIAAPSQLNVSAIGAKHLRAIKTRDYRWPIFRSIRT